MRFTEHDLEVIAKHVNANKYNLQKAFRDAAAELGNRTPKMIHYKWYRSMRYSTSIFGLDKSHIDNTKIITKSPVQQMASYSKQLSKIKGKTASSKQKVAVLKSALKSLAKNL